MLTGLGELISESAGVLNVGLEGMMLMGAYGGFVVALATGSTWLGFIGGAVAGALASLVMVFLCVRWGLDQIVVGIGILLGAEGLTSLLHAAQFAHSYPRLGRPAMLGIPWLSDLPVVGRVVFGEPYMVYLTILAVALAAWMIWKTPWGLSVRATGERPEAVDAAGVNVVLVRSLAVTCAGVFAGLGGAYLSLVSSGNFIPFMTGGRGFMALVLAMLARGRPLWLAAGALLFGFATALTTALQLFGVDVRPEIVNSLPFLVVLVVLALFGRNDYLP
ncbi:MAG TPA: ABC transporter permease, partial [Actinobacteria bacterium]|nr:ABC transporter permease [Actinomycetota bacterium]